MSEGTAAISANRELIADRDVPRQPTTGAAHRLMRDVLEVTWKLGKEEKWLSESLAEIEDEATARTLREFVTPAPTYHLHVAPDSAYRSWWRRILRWSER